MADQDREARWQGAVDAKLDYISGQLGSIQGWQTAHEALDTQRFGRLELLVDHDKEQKTQIANLMHTVVGNGQEGLMVRTAKLEGAVGGIKRFGWLLLGAVVTTGVGAIVAILMS